MNLRILFPSLILVVTLFVPTLHAYEPPSERQLSQVLANPNMIRAVLGDANGEQAADLLVRILTRINDSNMNQSQKNYMASYYVARVTFLLGREANVMASRLLPLVPRELVPAVVAGLSVGGRGSADFRELLGEDAGLLQAANAPYVLLSEPVYEQLLVSLGAAQSLPPVVTDSLPPTVPVGIPPPTTEEPAATPTRRATRRPPPPIPSPYAGQSGSNLNP